VSIEDAAVYVAAAYGAILVALIVLFALAARRLAGINRQVRALREAVERRRAAGDAGLATGLVAPPAPNAGPPTSPPVPPAGGPATSPAPPAAGAPD
jgi:hypothetical protein